MTTNHITREHGQISAIRCKACGRTIQGLVPSDHPDHTRVRKAKDGTIIREVSLVLRPNNAYREIVILCHDANGIGHRHVTHICANCIPTVSRDKDALTRLMIADIEDQEENEALPKTIGNLLKSRVVEGVE